MFFWKSAEVTIHAGYATAQYCNRLCKAIGDDDVWATDGSATHENRRHSHDASRHYGLSVSVGRRTGRRHLELPTASKQQSLMSINTDEH